MADCCASKACDLEKLPKAQSRVLWIVLAINAVMFVVELTGGLLANSLSLTGDSLDMLGDSIAYGSSLYVINRGIRAKARSAQLKGYLMIVIGLAVLGRAVHQFLAEPVPVVMLMAPIGALALVANLACLFFLTRHKNDDVNMSSVWLCSRNDIIANTAVLGAAGLVYFTKSPWPDLLVGLGITFLFLRSAASVLSDARAAVGMAPILGAQPVTED